MSDDIADGDLADVRFRDVCVDFEIVRRDDGRDRLPGHRGLPDLRVLHRHDAVDGGGERRRSRSGP